MKDSVWVHPREVPRAVKRVETKSRMVVARGCESESFSKMGTGAGEKS